MSEISRVNGTCVCGEVTIQADVVNTPRLRVCHCDMCRKHTSGGFYSIETVPGSVIVHGPAESFKSSDWAERGFCGTCGSTLWYGTLHDGLKNLSAGLFENAGGGALGVEYFSDACPSGYALAGEHKKLTIEETVAMFGAYEGDAK